MNKKQIINAISESKDSSQLPRLLEPKFNDKINVLSASKKQNLSRLKSLRIQQKKKYLIISTVSENQVVIIFGDLATGKTTQLPQYILEAELNEDLCIGITQTGDIDVISASKKVCKEMGCSVGNMVGYQTAFVNQSGSSTKIKYLRDSVLLDLYLAERTLKEFGIIIVEDIHVRSVRTDVLLRLLQSIMNDNKTLKVLVTTTSKNTELISSYFNEAPIISVQRQLRKISLVNESIKDNNYFKHSLKIINRIHNDEKSGDILVFIALKGEIQAFCNFLPNIKNLSVVSTFYELEEITISKETKRTLIVGTTQTIHSVNLNSVRFIIDWGMIREMCYDSGLCYKVFQTRTLSKLESDLRRNIAGRTERGICYRLYTKEEYKSFLDEPPPSINFEYFSEIYLKMLGSGLDPMLFNFIYPIDRKVLEECKTLLNDLELVDHSNNLTPKGSFVKGLPLGLMEGMTLWWSQHYKCTFDIIIIMSMLKAKDVFIRSKKSCSQECSCHRSFFDEDGDYFTVLNLYNKFLENKTKEWCKSNFLDFRTLMKVEARVTTLKELMKVPLLTTLSERQNVKNVLIKVFFRNICIRQCSGTYTRFDKDDSTFINQYSALLKENCHVILYDEIIKTRRPFMYGIMKLDESILKNFPDEMKAINYSPSVTHRDPLYVKQQINLKEKKCPSQKQKVTESKDLSSFYGNEYNIEGLDLSLGTEKKEGDSDFDNDGDFYYNDYGDHF